MNILLFAGTTEGRRLAEALWDLPLRATICVATDYGGETLGEMPGRFSVLVGRMDVGAMRELMARTAFDLIVDATHPYAVDVSRNIRSASAAAGVPYLRLVRESSPVHAGIRVDSAAAAAQMLREMAGPVLLTTGVKDLAAYTAVPDYAERMYARVLPSVESIRVCEELGYRRNHIIAMQGPFSRELNVALMRQYGIRVLVTKDGGAEGGFPDKLLAAEDAGAQVIVIGRPGGDEGVGLAEALRLISERLEAST